MIYHSVRCHIPCRRRVILFVPLWYYMTSATLSLFHWSCVSRTLHSATHEHFTLYPPPSLRITSPLQRHRLHGRWWRAQHALSWSDSLPQHTSLHITPVLTLDVSCMKLQCTHFLWWRSVIDRCCQIAFSLAGFLFTPYVELTIMMTYTSIFTATPMVGLEPTATRLKV